MAKGPVPDGEARAIAQRAFSKFLQAVEDGPTQEACAKELGIAKTTFNEHYQMVEKVLLVLAVYGKKMVSKDLKCMTAKRQGTLEEMANVLMTKGSHLYWNEEEVE